jgi:hypothetical protein
MKLPPHFGSLDNNPYASSQIEVHLNALKAMYLIQHNCKTE